jgi:hypothetical protein
MVIDMTKLKFKSVRYENGVAYAFFVIDNLTSEQEIERKTLEQVSVMPIQEETQKAYRALIELEDKLNTQNIAGVVFYDIDNPL